MALFWADLLGEDPFDVGPQDNMQTTPIVSFFFSLTIRFLNLAV